MVPYYCLTPRLIVIRLKVEIIRITDYSYMYGNDHDNSYMYINY